MNNTYSIIENYKISLKQYQILTALIIPICGGALYFGGTMMEFLGLSFNLIIIICLAVLFLIIAGYLTLLKRLKKKIKIGHLCFKETHLLIDYEQQKSQRLVNNKEIENIQIYNFDYEAGQSSGHYRVNQQKVFTVLIKTTNESLKLNVLNKPDNETQTSNVEDEVLLYNTINEYGIANEIDVRLMKKRITKY